jgi:hypothetical protein
MVQGARPFASAVLQHRLGLQSSDCRVRDPESAGDVRKCVAGVDPDQGLALLIMVQRRVPAHMNAARFRANASPNLREQ